MRKAPPAPPDSAHAPTASRRTQVRPSQPFRLGAVGAAAASLLALSAGQTSAAPPAAPAPSTPRPFTPAPASAVTTAQDRAARAVARSLADGTWRARLRHAALTSDEVGLTALARHDGPSGLTS